MITPAGDPVSSPVSSGDGQNEFTFHSGSPGVLTISLKAHVTPSGVADRIKDKVHFTVDGIGNSTLAWDAVNAGGKPTANGDDLVATARFTGLPVHNSDFGKKGAAVYYDNTKSDETEYEVFFPGDANNNPGGFIVSDPNWFYYWKEGGVCGIPADAEYEFNADFGFTRPGVDTIVRLGPLAPHINTGPATYTHKVTGQSIVVTGNGRGIKCVAETVRHELHHLEIYNASLGLSDLDDMGKGDRVADILEPSLDGLNTEINDRDTYDLRGDYADYGDNEVRCRKLELSPLPIFPDKDWANPGAQNKNQVVR
jgi:hypothetical protein